MDRRRGRYEAIVIGASAGGPTALLALLSAFPADYALPILIVQHIHPVRARSFTLYYQEHCALRVREADEKEPIRAGHVYFAPPNYHLLVEDDRTLALSVDEKVNYARPSIDVLFESAADVYGAGLVGVILSGANRDGAYGLRYVRQRGGLAVVQDPAEAQVAHMPQAALEATPVDHVLSVAGIGDLLVDVGR